MKDVVIGSNCNIGDHCFIESGVVIGNNVTIKNGNMLFEGVRLEDGVFVGPHVFFTNDLYPRSPRLPQARKRYAQKEWLEPTLIKHGASLGAGAVILAGITIGEFAMVGAGSIVTKDVQPYSLVLGNPTRFAGWVCQCGQKIIIRGKEGNCNACGRSYYKGNSQLNIREVDA
jgi:acetyltransferase-like isoleucine patch superfamily enzyme